MSVRHADMNASAFGNVTTTDRRSAIALVLTGALALPGVLFAQQSGKVWRVGFFYYGSRQSALDTRRYQEFERGMRELGYEEGKNLVIEARFADGQPERLPDIAAQLVKLKVDVIVATGSPVYRALQQASVTIPTAVTVSSDPLGTGLAKTLARPGGNFTGLSENNVELVTKHLQLLRTVVPRLSRVALLSNPTNTGSTTTQLKRVKAAAEQVGVDIVQVESGTIDGNERGLAAASKARVNALIILNDTFFTQQSRQLAELAIQYRLPSIFGTQDYARAGGLLSYGPEVTDNFRRVAMYVDKILKGAKPGDLPMEQPTRYLLTINRKTATALDTPSGVAAPR
jgi:putative tryptophan/tyrosine transport system substrate-binding protein